TTATTTKRKRAAKQSKQMEMRKGKRKKKNNNRQRQLVLPSLLCTGARRKSASKLLPGNRRSQLNTPECTPLSRARLRNDQPSKQVNERTHTHTHNTHMDPTNTSVWRGT